MAVMHRNFQEQRMSCCKNQGTQSHHLLSKTFWIHTSLTTQRDEQVKATQKLKALAERNQEIILRGTHGWLQRDLTEHKRRLVRILINSKRTSHHSGCLINVKIKSTGHGINISLLLLEQFYFNSIILCNTLKIN